jgi:hypothetical protein
MITPLRAELPPGINSYFVTLSKLGLFIMRIRQRSPEFIERTPTEERAS